jgi:hypothetical protein
MRYTHARMYTHIHPPDLIRNQYDEMVKYATALRLRTAETEADLTAFYPQQPSAPYIPGSCRARPCNQDDLPLPVPGIRGIATQAVTKGRVFWKLSPLCA